MICMMSIQFQSPSYSKFRLLGFYYIIFMINKRVRVKGGTTRRIAKLEGLIGVYWTSLRMRWVYPNMLRAQGIFSAGRKLFVSSILL